MFLRAGLILDIWGRMLDPHAFLYMKILIDQIDIRS